METESDSKEEETVLQIPGSSPGVGFLVWGLTLSVIGFWVSSSSMLFKWFLLILFGRSCWSFRFVMVHVP